MNCEYFIRKTIPNCENYSSIALERLDLNRNVLREFLCLPAHSVISLTNELNCFRIRPKYVKIRSPGRHELYQGRVNYVL